jgi:hypothetical protein
VRRLAAGGGHSAVLTDASSLKELCEFKLAEIVNLSNARLIEDIASRTGADALARLCEKLRYGTENCGFVLMFCVAKFPCNLFSTPVQNEVG